MHRTDGLNFIKINGLNSFSAGPPKAIVEKNWLNSVQEEISHVIEKADFDIKQAKEDTMDQLYPSIVKLFSPAFDVNISNQSEFNAVIERMDVNRYKIIDSARSLFFKFLSGGYQCSGASSFLSGGDTWGWIETNNCGEIFFEADTYLDFNNTQGYLKVNKDDSALQNVNIQGTGTVASAIQRSFLLVANRVMFFNCKTSTRLSNTTFSGFEGSATSLHNLTSKYIGCSSFALTSSGIVRGFYLGQNLSESYAYDIDSTATFAYGYHTCDNLLNCTAKKIDNAVADSAVGYFTCNRLSDCVAEDIDGLNVIGFNTCTLLSSCYVFDIQGTSAATGYSTCNILSSCQAQQLDAVSNSVGFQLCAQLSACFATDIDASIANALGYNSCNELSACKAFDISGDNQGHGFSSSNQISACYAQQIDGNIGDGYGFLVVSRVSSCYANDIDSVARNSYGFVSSSVISACRADDIDGGGAVVNGFNDITYGSSLFTTEAANAANDWIDTNDAQIANKFSCPAVFT